MANIKIKPVGSAVAESVLLTDFLAAIESCDRVNNVITIESIQYTMDSVEFPEIGLLKLKAGIDCSLNPDYPLSVVGEGYKCTVAGKIGGAGGAVVEANDLIVCTTDSPAGTQAAVGANFQILQNNLDVVQFNIDVAATAASAAAALVSEGAAAVSAAAALVSEGNAATSETNAGVSAAAALVSEGNAATSETNAGVSEGAAAVSAAAALVSEGNAATSETNAGVSDGAAAVSAAAALVSEWNAATSETNSGVSAGAAAVSAAAALVSEGNAATSEINAATSETNAGISAVAAAASALSVLSSAKVYRALLTQEGALDPTVELINDGEPNYIGAIVATRIGKGVYNLNKALSFPDSKTFVFAGQNATSSEIIAADVQGDSSNIRIVTNVISPGTRMIRSFDKNGNVNPQYSFRAIAFDSISNAVEQADGKIVVAGSFSILNGVVLNNIARINTDGTIDETFVTGTGFNGILRALAIQVDGKILVGGNFTNYNGTAVNRAVRLNTDGSIDATFNVGTGFNLTVQKFAIQADTTIICVGAFTDYNGTPAAYIVRLDAFGVIDGTFTYGTGFDAMTASVAIQANGKILVGGAFANYNGTASAKIIRLNADGTVDGTFVVPGTGFDATVNCIAVQADGNILVGGSFTLYDITAAASIVRLTTLGAIDGTFVYGAGFAGGTGVNWVATQSDGKILVGGTFTTYKAVSALSLAKLDTNGDRILGYENSITSGTGVRYIHINQTTDEAMIVGDIEVLFQTISCDGILNRTPIEIMVKQ